MSIDYGIEWAYGEFRIARFKNGAVAESWKSPKPVTDLTSLSEAMYEAAHQVDISRGGSVAIAYEDDLHTHEFLEIPPVSGRDLNKLLERRVDQDKPFEGEASWRHHPVAKGTNIDGVLLHLMPKYVVDAVIRICEEFYLKPKLMVPLTEIISEYVPALSEDDDAALLLIALFDDRTQMVVSSGCGEILFVRELSYPWSEGNSTRLVTDINRTIGYAKQRIEGELSNAWLIGELASNAKTSIDGHIDLILELDPVAAEAEFWMTQVAALPQGLHSNFIPVLARSSITSKTFLRAAVMMTAVTLLATLLVSGTIEYTIFKNRIDQIATNQKVNELRETLEYTEREAARMSNEKAKLDLLNVDAFNLPAIFLSHLGDLIPAGLTLTKADIVRSENSWELRLVGKSLVSLSEAADLLSEFETALKSDPWNTNMTQSWENAWMRQLRAGSATQHGDIGFELRGEFR